MANLDIIRAWKDEEYRESLSAEQKKLLPENPAGLTELDDADLDPVAGGRPPMTYGIDCAAMVGGIAELKSRRRR